MAKLAFFILLFTLFNLTTLLPHHVANANNHHHDHHRHSKSKSNGGGGGPRSPSINPHGTHATLTLNNFARGGDGGGASECDGKFHPLPQKVVALSTGWYKNGAFCGRMIKITAKNGRTTLAKVVDECDSRRGCKNDVVDASKSVWNDLGLKTAFGEVPVSWSFA